VESKGAHSQIKRDFGKAAGLKSETRNPKTERRPKSEGSGSGAASLDSGLRFRVSFGLWSSDFGFGMHRPDQPSVLRWGVPDLQVLAAWGIVSPEKGFAYAFDSQ
jgi:hypothetical protein